MDGRFPFDPTGGQRQSQLSQMRAALGLPPGLDEALFLQRTQQQQQVAQQQQRQQQELQREMQLLLQEQLDQRVQEEQIRAIKDHLHEFPDLQQHYQSLLLNEQLQRQRRNSGLGGAGLASGPVRQVGSVQQLALLREQVNLRTYEEQLLRQQQQLAGVLRADDVAQPSHNPAAASLFASASVTAQQSALHQIRQRSAQQVTTPQIQALTQNIAALEALSSNPAVSGANNLVQVSPPMLGATTNLHAPQIRSFGSAFDEPGAGSVQTKKRRSPNSSVANPEKVTTKKQRKKKKPTARRRGSALAPEADEDEASHPRYSLSPSSSVESPFVDGVYPLDSALETVARAADLVAPENVVKGTITDILDAAVDSETIDEAAKTLATLTEANVEVGGIDEVLGEIGSEKFLTSADHHFIQTSSFTAYLPQLPEEPLLPELEFGSLSGGGAKALPHVLGAADFEIVQDANISDKPNGQAASEKLPKKTAPVLEYPYPIDTWWPSISGMRRERRSCGEASDEDDFEETMDASNSNPWFRANEGMIKKRLSSKLEPGVLEKLPHCRIHRIRTKQKKNSTAPELVYCWQVTELYPQEPMVNCSSCGTWRHAGCGGHNKPYSVNENAKSPFVAVCESCNAEEHYLEDYRVGRERIERQRMEQIRRGLATSSVMRHFSYSKHGGTYKWPLGSVSATHIGGHTRSVHARHDKAEKQWSDMATRLGRGYGYRQKERVRSRTKELERLLTSIEDAEGFTDRHNMYVFLHRDTQKQKPAGFEKEIRNIFDPAEDLGIETDENDEEQSAAVGTAIEENGALTIETCIREGCDRKQRFDSRFCSDACGVATLEMDLLRTLQDAGDMHPSVLRSSI